MENSSSIARHQMEEVLSSSKSKAAAAAVTVTAERKPRPKPEQKVDCPRCKSGNTKFCYYNNYSMSQPRYFCKACRRYWTHGGSLRNVPIGGGCRKTKRSSSSSSDLHNKVAVPPAPVPMVPPAVCMDFPNVLPTFISAGFELPSRDHHHHLSLATFMSSSSSSSSSSNPAVAAPGGPSSFLDVLRGGGAGLLDGGHRQNNGYYGGNGMVMPLPAPPTFGVAGPMQHGGLAIGGIGGAAAAQGMLPNGTMMGAGEEGEGSGMKAMMGLQWQPQLGSVGGGGGSTTGAQQNNMMMDNGNNGGDDGGNDGSSRDCYWINNGGPNPWQSLINSGSLM